MARAGGLKKLVGVNLEEIDAREINSVPVFDDVVVRVGRYGPYLERVRDGESQRANLPDDLPPDELTPEVAEQLFSVPQEGRSLGVDPVTGHEIVAKEGRYGPYVTEILPGRRGARRDQRQRRGRRPRPSRSRAPVRCSSHDHRDGHARGRAAAAVAAAAGRHRPGERRGDHRAERPLRAVPEEGHRLALADRARSSCSRSPSTRRWRSTSSPSSAGAARRPPPRRCASWASTPPPRSRW